MDSIHIHQVLRPLRHAYLIKEGDHAGADRAVSLNTIIWGGIYNPIISVTPETECNEILKEFDPDELVNLTSTPLSAAISEGFEQRIVNFDQVTRNDAWDGQVKLGFGFHMIPIVRHIFEKEARFIREESLASFYTCPDSIQWNRFFGFQCGSFSGLPNLSINFKAEFMQALNARELYFDPKTLDEIVELVDSPLRLTGYGLDLYGGFGNFPKHIVYIGDHRELSDLLEFWNIRATGRMCIFIPVDLYRLFKSMIRRLAKPNNGNAQIVPELQKGQSVTDELFLEVCDWIRSLDTGPKTRRTWRPQFGGSENDAGTIEANKAEEISLLEGSQMTPAKFIKPEYLMEDEFAMGDFSWAVEIKMSGGTANVDFVFSIPYERKIERSIISGITHKGPGEARIGKQGLVVFVNNGTNNLFLSPLRTKDVLCALFESAGLKAEVSGPGQYMEQIIKKMGHLHFDCRIFKVRGVREIIKKLSNGSILTQGNMRDIIMNTVPDEFGQNWRSEFYKTLIVRSGQRAELDFGVIFQQLLEKRVIRPGFEMKCENCFAKEWYHVSEFDEEYVCRYCFTKQRVNFSNKKEWQYKADGLFRIENSAQGSIAAIVALWRIQDFHSLDEGRYQCSVTLQDKSSQNAYELDFVCMRVGTFKAGYELVFGQAKNFVDFSPEEVGKMGTLSAKFLGRPYLCFSTMKESFSAQEKSAIGQLVREGHKVIALTRQELDPYSLYERFRSAPKKSVVRFSDLSLNTVHLNVM
jgi:hypothetical protein